MIDVESKRVRKFASLWTISHPARWFSGRTRTWAKFAATDINNGLILLTAMESFEMARHEAIDLKALPAVQDTMVSDGKHGIKEKVGRCANNTRIYNTIIRVFLVCRSYQFEFFRV